MAIGATPKDEMFHEIDSDFTLKIVGYPPQIGDDKTVAKAISCTRYFAIRHVSASPQ